MQRVPENYQRLRKGIAETVENYSPTSTFLLSLVIAYLAQRVLEHGFDSFY